MSYASNDLQTFTVMRGITIQFSKELAGGTLFIGKLENFQSFIRGFHFCLYFSSTIIRLNHSCYDKYCDLVSY